MMLDYCKLIYETLKKDIFIFISYKFAAFSFIFLIIANTVMFFYFSKLVNISASDQIINSSYFVYVIYGIMISDFTIQILNRLPREVRNYQLTGIIESLKDESYKTAAQKEFDLAVSLLLEGEESEIIS